MGIHPDLKIWEFEDLKNWEFEDLKIWEFEAVETHPDQIFPSPIPGHFLLEFFSQKTPFFYGLCPQNIPKVHPGSGADPGRRRRLR